jgi:hypothetical protein
MKHFSMEKSMPVKTITVACGMADLQITNYTLTFSLLTKVETEADMEQGHLDQNISFSKITSFIAHILDGSIVYEMSDSDDVIARFQDFNNNFIVLPHMTENTLLACLHSKLNAITAPNTVVEKVAIHDTDLGVTYEYILTEEGDGYDELPDTEEWEQELSYWPGCWWTRQDINTVDKVAANQEEYDRWCKLRDEKDLDELHMNLFTEIENAYKMELEEPAGDVIEVDFKASDAQEKRHIWKPVLLD